jgi:hypothetical protein
MQETLHERVVKADEKALYAEKCSRRHWVFFKLLINTGMEPGYAAAAQWGTSNRHPQPDICCSEPLWQLPPKNKGREAGTPGRCPFLGEGHWNRSRQENNSQEDQPTLASPLPQTSPRFFTLSISGAMLPNR